MTLLHLGSTNISVCFIPTLPVVRSLGAQGALPMGQGHSRSCWVVPFVSIVLIPWKVAPHPWPLLTLYSQAVFSLILVNTRKIFCLERHLTDMLLLLFVVAVQLPSHVPLCDLMDCSMPGLPVPHHIAVCPSLCPLN